MPISLSVSPIADSTGKIVGASKIARGVGDRRRAEEQKDLLLQEMNHRIKNLFSLANAIVNLSGRKATSTAALVSDLQSRFGALARAHCLTLPKTTDSGAEPVATLHALLYKLTEPYLADRDAESRVVVTGPDVPIGPVAVTNFALILHELATNALKYGSLAVEHGKVRIECLDEGKDFGIIWREQDTPKESGDPPGEGFGSRLVRATAEGPLGGRFARKFTGDGVEIRLKLPRQRLSE